MKRTCHRYIKFISPIKRSEPCSRLEIAKILLGLETASHVSNKHVEFIKCLAFRLEPITPGSFNDLDGEVIESGPIQAHVMPAAINVFTG